MLRGRTLKNLRPHQLASVGAAYVPDDRCLFFDLTAAENLRVARGSRPLDELLAWFPALPPLLGRKAGLLSGGEQQMLALARAFLMKPRLMLLDEPSLGLAPLVVRAIFEIIRAINTEDRVAVLLVEQNARLALDMSTKAYVLEVGRLAIEGSSAELKGNDAVRRSYLGY
jgi:branched-chain amino acid transport system ATP-binding protein